MDTLLENFMRDGFVIVPQVIPPDRLERLRAQYEILVDRQRAIWAENRKPNDPPGGVWETHTLPRLAIEEVVEPETADALEFLLDENIMSVNRQLLQSSEVVLQRMYLMCNPVRDRGPDRWHHDIHPSEQPPLGSLHKDLLANGPATVQWNIALHDDSIFWVVPASHARTTSEQESRCLLESLRKPLPTGVPADLKAGDGVVYTNALLHWGSNYSSKRRRTLLVGYRRFGGPNYPFNPHYRWWDLGFTQHLPPRLGDAFRHYRQLLEDELDQITSIYKAIIAKDEAGFRAGLDTLHPAADQQVVCAALLGAMAKKIQSDPTGRAQIWSQHKQIAQRFTPLERDTLYQQFAVLDEKLQSGTEQYVCGFLSEPARLLPYDLPADFTLEYFVANWHN